MAIGENKGVKILRSILELDPLEFLGICKILGVKIYDTTSEMSVDGATVKEVANVVISVRQFEDIWVDVCDAVDNLNRTQKRNLQKLVNAATKKEK